MKSCQRKNAKFLAISSQHLQCLRPASVRAQQTFHADGLHIQIAHPLTSPLLHFNPTILSQSRHSHFRAQNFPGIGLFHLQILSWDGINCPANRKKLRQSRLASHNELIYSVLRNINATIPRTGVGIVYRNRFTFKNPHLANYLPVTTYNSTSLSLLWHESGCRPGETSNAA